MAKEFLMAFLSFFDSIIYEQSRFFKGKRGISGNDSECFRKELT
jgi:hypothetical protein